MQKIRIRDRFFVLLVGIMDVLQGSILKNYSVFAFLASHAPQKIGAEACCYRAYKEFEIACKRVPAYKEFMKQSGWRCDSKNYKTIFESLPLTDKNNYILPYKTEDRCVDGKFMYDEVVIDESSGSTGVPYNWVRCQKEREIVKKLISVYLRYCYGSKKYIILNTFSMGAWATGFNMALAAQTLGVVKSTGPDIDKIFHTLKFFGNKYPYILNGYPPFLKHLFDEGQKRNFDWKKYEIHVLVGGEGMSEGLRQYLYNYAKTVYSGYGASDLEIGMAGENPLTVKIRHLCYENPDLRKTLFGQDQRLPMIFQYNPLDHFVEIINRQIVVTISKPWTLSPRIRYNIKDEGGMITFDQMRQKLSLHNIDLEQLERECEYPRWYVPFLYVFGRKDSTVSIMGANIYPEDVENIVYSDHGLQRIVNSFSISLEEDSDRNPRPYFAFELIEMDNKEKIQKDLVDRLSSGLERLSMDFKKAKEEYPEAVKPVVRLYGMSEGPFKANEGRIKKRYIHKT